MGRSLKFNIDGCCYSQSEVKRKLIKLKKECEESDKTIEPTHSEFNFLFELAQMHPNAEEKIRCGVNLFFIRVIDQGGYPSTCWHILHPNEDKTEISLLKAVKGVENRNNKLLRESIRAQTDHKRELFLKAFENRNYFESEHSGERIKKNTGLIHCDHKHPYTFKVLCQEFSKKEGLCLKNYDLSKMEEKEAIIERWQKFHQENAELQIVSKSENLSELKRIR